MPTREENSPPPPAGAAAATCPICRKPAAQSLPHFPFCSKRCKLLDLGRWLGGQYRLEAPIDGEDWQIDPRDPPDEASVAEGTP